MGPTLICHTNFLSESRNRLGKTGILYKRIRIYAKERSCSRHSICITASIILSTIDGIGIIHKKRLFSPRACMTSRICSRMTSFKVYLLWVHFLCINLRFIHELWFFPETHQSTFTVRN